MSIFIDLLDKHDNKDNPTYINISHIDYIIYDEDRQSWKNTKKLKYLLTTSFKVLFGFASIVFVLWTLFRENIIEIIANKNYLFPDHIYSSSDWFLVVLAVIIFNFISLLFIYIFIALKN